MLTALNFLSTSWVYMQPSSNHEILLPLFVIPLPYTYQIHELLHWPVHSPLLACLPNSLLIKVLTIRPVLEVCHLPPSPQYQLVGEWSSPHNLLCTFVFLELSQYYLLQVGFSWYQTLRQSKSTNVYWEITPIKGEKKEAGLSRRSY